MSRNTRFFLFSSSLVLVVGLCTGILAYYGGLTTLASPRSAGPVELKYVPPTAAVVAYANVKDVMNSQFRQKIRHVLPDSEQKGQEEFERETGINLEQDIDYVIAWMSPTGEPKGATGVVMLRGRFDPARLEALATTHGGSAEVVNGIKILKSFKQHHGRDHSPAVAFLETGLLAIGEEASVRAVAANRGGASISANQDLTSLIADLEGSSNLWAVGRMDAIAHQARLPEQIASQIPAVKWFAASSAINGGLSGVLRAEARDEEAAKNLRDVIQGFMALAKLQAGSKPELQPLLQSLVLSGTGTTVALSFEVPEAFIDAVAEKMKKPAAN